MKPLMSLFFIILIFSLPLFTQTHRRFVHVPIRKTWDDARTYCREHHIDLAVFGNQTEYEALQSPCDPSKWCWIGLYRDSYSSGMWKWLNGEEVSFTSWYQSQPNAGFEQCVLMKDKYWWDYYCSYDYFEFLCYDEEEEDLILVQEEKTWEEALEHCRTLQTSSTSDSDHLFDLTHMHAEIDNLIQNAQTQEVWVGLRFLAGHWFWVDDSPLEDQLEKELPMCPDPRMNCGTMSKSGGRPSPGDCSERRNFFCLKRNLF